MKAPVIRIAVLGIALLSASAPARAFLVEDAEQRRDFAAALEAQRRGDVRTFKRLRTSLDGYVLRGYLDYEHLKNRLPQAPPDEVARFLDEHGFLAVSGPIRDQWLKLLASRGDWERFLRYYQNPNNDAELACLRARHLLSAGELPIAADTAVELAPEIERLWLTGRAQPKACDALFTAWKKAGNLSTELVWERIRLAMESRNLTLAGELASYLEPSLRVWVRRYQAMHRDPARELDRLNYPLDTPMARTIVRHGIVQLAARDTLTAMRRWEALKRTHQFFGEDDNYILREVGILAARERSPFALSWLAAVSADPRDESLQLWRVRAALQARDWEATRRFIAALPEARQREGQWRYWKARAMEATGETRAAEREFREIAQSRDYYGFLAADRVGADYAMQHAPVAATDAELNAVRAHPGVQAAQELLRLGMAVDARRQWEWVTRRMNPRELAVAAVVASDWGWHDRAILTASRSGHQDDLELRFPVLFRDEIEANAGRYDLDAGWVYGVVRQESAFVVDARSPVGALGLMQLMPATGRMTGRKLNVPVRGAQSLLNIENNLRLGSAYLRDVLSQHGGNHTLATASYNAGPNRVTSWLPDRPLDAEVWVETIPFTETREYVKNVLAFAAVYDHRLGQKPLRLQSRMPAVAP